MKNSNTRKENHVVDDDIHKKAKYSNYLHQNQQ